MINAHSADNGTKLDALMFFIRKYGRNLLIAVLSSIVLYFVFYFFIEDLTLAALSVRRADSTTATEAVYSESLQAEGENFINLNGTHILKDSKRVNCDLLMVAEGEEYGDNYFGFNAALSAGECAVSNNLMYSYGISLGDTLSVSGTDTVYTVKLAMEPSRGLDEEYLHEGAIILGNNKELLSEKDYSYITFMKNADGITNLKKIVFLSQKREASVSDFASALILTVAFSALSVLLWELLIGRRSWSDLRRFAELGARPCDLYLKVVLGILFKYFLPEIAVFLIWHRSLGCYRESYIYPAVIGILINLCILIIYSVLLFRRVSLCRMKRR